MTLGAVITNEVNPMTPKVTSLIEGIAVTSEDFFNLPSPPQMTPLSHVSPISAKKSKRKLTTMMVINIPIY